MSLPAAWPFGQSRWDAHAAALAVRVQLLQLHVESDWLYAVCTQCGWELEATRPEIERFRFEYVSHVCASPEPSTVLVPAPVEEVLF